MEAVPILFLDELYRLIDSRGIYNNWERFPPNYFSVGDHRSKNFVDINLYFDSLRDSDEVDFRINMEYSLVEGKYLDKLNVDELWNLRHHFCSVKIRVGRGSTWDNMQRSSVQSSQFQKLLACFKLFPHVELADDGCFPVGNIFAIYKIFLKKQIFLNDTLLVRHVDNPVTQEFLGFQLTHGFLHSWTFSPGYPQDNEWLTKFFHSFFDSPKTEDLRVRNDKEFYSERLHAIVQVWASCKNNRKRKINMNYMDFKVNRKSLRKFGCVVKKRKVDECKTEYSTYRTWNPERRIVWTCNANDETSALICK
ncbi:hypothetical protein L596_028294 [Steinernema carpocapsae]|uniref:Uncharacterized protein n=1 Tax=Steinernema carpocapsae TaxID=34508 RepID=A0A4U5LY35_STECR|nr:hypothetical protein L596_028294 [Steinernema carpocapsae]